MPTSKTIHVDVGCWGLKIYKRTQKSSTLLESRDQVQKLETRESKDSKRVESLDS